MVREVSFVDFWYQTNGEDASAEQATVIILIGL